MGQWDDLIATILTDRSAESQHLLDRDPLKWVPKYLVDADRLRDRGEKLLAAGDSSQGSDDLRNAALFVWRSFLCAIIAVGQKYHLATETHDDLMAVMETINNELECPVLIDGFASAKIVRRYVEQSEPANDELDVAWEGAIKCVRRLLAFAE